MGWVRPGTDTPWVQWLISTFHRFVWAMFQEHPGKLTWNLKITRLKRNRIFQFWIPSLIFQGVWVSHQFLGTVSFGMVFLDPKFTAKQRRLKLVETLRCGFVLAWGLDLQTERFGQQDILVEFDFPSKTKMTSWKIHHEWNNEDVFPIKHVNFPMSMSVFSGVTCILGKLHTKNKTSGNT